MNDTKRDHIYFIDKKPKWTIFDKLSKKGNLGWASSMQKWYYRSLSLKLIYRYRYRQAWKLISTHTRQISCFNSIFSCKQFWNKCFLKEGVVFEEKDRLKLHNILSPLFYLAILFTSRNSSLDFSVNIMFVPKTSGNSPNRDSKTHPYFRLTNNFPIIITTQKYNWFWFVFLVPVDDG